MNLRTDKLQRELVKWKIGQKDVARIKQRQARGQKIQKRGTEE